MTTPDPTATDPTAADPTATDPTTVNAPTDPTAAGTGTGGTLPPDGSSSAPTDPTTAAQPTVPVPHHHGWYMCANCQSLFYPAGTGGRCPAGGQHAQTGQQFALPYSVW